MADLLWQSWPVQSNSIKVYGIIKIRPSILLIIAKLWGTLKQLYIRNLVSFHPSLALSVSPANLKLCPPTTHPFSLSHGWDRWFNKDCRFTTSFAFSPIRLYSACKESCGLWNLQLNQQSLTMLAWWRKQFFEERGGGGWFEEIQISEVLWMA